MEDPAHDLAQEICKTLTQEFKKLDLMINVDDIKKLSNVIEIMQNDIKALSEKVKKIDEYLQSESQ